MRLFTQRHFAARLFAAVTLSILLVWGPAQADDDDKAVIKVMTQNQYLGADLTPLVLAGSDPIAFNAAIIDVLTTIGRSNYPERVKKLARTIVKSNSDLIGLQEMWAFGCTPTSPTIPDPCSLFGPAFNDHLESTLNAIDDIGGKYHLAAQSQNLTVLDAGFPVPGIPVLLDTEDMIPDIFVTVIDRDVILAHDRVVTSPVKYHCPKPSLDGCNFENVASTSIGGIPLNIERGFVAVDAKVRGNYFRFVNTHSEVRFPDPTAPFSRFFQSAQASELLGILQTQPAPPNTRVLIVGDINSDPDDPYPSDETGPFLTPYQQFVSGLSFQGVPISAPYIDVWTLKRKPRPGLTCCEAADLRNKKSIHERRVDIVFSLDKPKKVKARTLNTRPGSKTPALPWFPDRLWPSDHATVVAKLWFDEDDDDDDEYEDDDD